MLAEYKIALYGDSIPYEYCSLLEQVLNSKNGNYSYRLINKSIPGETSTQVFERLIVDDMSKYDCVLLHCGMNDWRKGLAYEETLKNFSNMIDRCNEQNIRTLLAAVTPDWNAKSLAHSQDYKGSSEAIVKINKSLESLAHDKKVRFIDLYSEFLDKTNSIVAGLKDAIHPNSLGQEIICNFLNHFIPRENLTIVLPFAGRYANCNYKCPYCYVPDFVNVDKEQYHDVNEWEEAFLKSFGSLQHITFYLSYGEPTIAKQFIELLDMVGKHDNWEVMVTSNLSADVERLRDLKIVRDGRLNINSSFHPTEISFDKFVAKLDALRSMGIECPVIYVLWPGENLEKFEYYFDKFREKKYVMHLRRFRGRYQGKKYPESYTQDQIDRFVKYMDKGTISHMLSNKSSLGALSYLGMHHILVNEKGDVELCDEYPGDMDIGNIFKGDVKLYTKPKPFPGPVSLGAVDDIANLLELGYDELRGNHVESFSRQGGVYKDKNNEPVYRYENFDFSDKLKVDKEFYQGQSIKQNFDSKLKWFIKHKLWYYSIERRYHLAKQLIRSKLLQVLKRK